MSIKAALHHLTRYRYDRPVSLGPQVIRLRPAPHCRTRIVSHGLKVLPDGHFVNHQQDLYGNWQARCVFPEPVTELRIEVDLVADMTAINPFDFFVETAAEYWPFSYAEEIAPDIVIYQRTEALTPMVKSFLDGLDWDKQRTIDMLVKLNRKAAQTVKYIKRIEPGVQTPEETLALGSGSCRDSSWLLIQVLRHFGFVARFVSGYLIQLEPDGGAPDGAEGAKGDFADLHAWVEAFVPGAGWIGLDPTSGLLAGEGHIPLAATPHYRNAAPLSGSASLAKVDFSFDMTVTRLTEAEAEG
jgi:transglutaminase-like putative cysteine protease